MRETMKIRVENWVDGMLQVEEEIWDNYVLAHKRIAELHRHHSEHSRGHKIKLYDENDQMMHSVNSPDYDSSTYA
jgi:hypothetical protein